MTVYCLKIRHDDAINNKNILLKFKAFTKPALMIVKVLKTA